MSRKTRKEIQLLRKQKIKALTKTDNTSKIMEVLNKYAREDERDRRRFDDITKPRFICSGCAQIFDIPQFEEHIDNMELTGEKFGKFRGNDNEKSN